MKKVATLLLTLALLVVTMTACTNDPLPKNEPYTLVKESETLPTTPFSFDMACYNLWGSGLTTQKAEQINRYFREQQFALVGLQEVDNGAQRTGGHNYLQLLSSENALPFMAFSPSFVLGETYGLGILSQSDFVRKHTYLLPYPYQSMRDNIEPRILMRAVVKVGDVPVVLYNTHLSYENVKMDGELVRTKQLQFIADILKSDPNPFVVLTGDFNIDNADELKVLEEAGFARAFTNADNSGKLLIDNILFSTNLTASNQTIDDLKDESGKELSDHALLSLTLSYQPA